MKNGDLPASPVLFQVSSNGSKNPAQVGHTTYWTGGLSKREHFAAMAMQGMLANSALNYGDDFIAITEKDVVAADALLAKLEKPIQNGQ